MIKQNFNQDWYFSKGSGGALSMLMDRKQKLVKVSLPHDASIREMREDGEILGSGNGYFKEENCNYTKDFELSLEDQDKVVWLEFEGVYQNAFVYVNNAYVGKHPYGYSNFYLDITKFVTFDKTNHIQVVVKNGVPSGRWYTGGGIYRDVKLMTSDRLHFIPEGIHLSTAELDESLAVIQADAVIEYTGVGMKDVLLTIELLDDKGEIAASAKKPFTIFEHSRDTYRLRLELQRPKLWDLIEPNLYTYRAFLSDGASADEETGTFGIRKLSLDTKNGLRLNGKTIKLRGGCIHHDDGIVGAAVFSDSAKRKVKRLKEAGYNAIRSSHYPMSRAMLSECDSQGMLVMDELTDVWTNSKVDFDYGMHFSEWWEEDVTNMVNKDFNHPCVIMYSIGNEIPQTGNKIDNAWGKKIADKIHQLDPTRYTTNSINFMLSIMDRVGEFSKQMEQAPTDAVEINSFMNDHVGFLRMLSNSDMASMATQEAFSQVEISGYNYASGRYEADGIRYPERIIVGSETNPGDLFDNWELVKKLPYVIGDFSWTAWEYLGESGIGKWSYGETAATFYCPYPWKMAYCADFNLIGDRRPVSYWREIIWGLRKEPYIAVSPPMHYGEKCNLSSWGFTDGIHSWTWDGFEGKPIRVEVYADGDEVELLLNGSIVSRKVLGDPKKGIAVFDIIYQPGKLEAVSYQNKTLISRHVLTTSGNEVSLHMQAYKKYLTAGECDLCYIEISLLDNVGNLNMQQIKDISISVEGAAVLEGYGSADPQSEENYFDTKAKSFEGRLLAAIRSTNESGLITITIHADGCEDAVLKLESI